MSLQAVHFPCQTLRWPTAFLLILPHLGRAGTLRHGLARGNFPTNGRARLYSRASSINMKGLTTFSLGDDGAYFKGSCRKGGDLLPAHDNMTLRPTELQICQ